MGARRSITRSRIRGIRLRKKWMYDVKGRWKSYRLFEQSEDENIDCTAA
jgi:hypothetical protein